MDSNIHLILQSSAKVSATCQIPPARIVMIVTQEIINLRNSFLCFIKDVDSNLKGMCLGCKVDVALDPTVVDTAYS